MTVSFKEFEHKNWEISVDQYDSSFWRLTSQSIPDLLDSVNCKKWTRLLDVASGPWYVSAYAFDAGATVTWIDFSQMMVDRARKNVPWVDSHVWDAEALDFPRESFDAVVMNFWILHLEYPEKALNEAWRVLTPWGTYAFTVWQTAAVSKAFGIVMDAIRTHGTLGVDIPKARPFFYYADQENAKNAMQSAWFLDITYKKIDMNRSLRDWWELFDAFYNGTARTWWLLRLQSKEALIAIKQHIIDTSEQYMIDWVVHIPMWSLIISGTKK